MKIKKSSQIVTLLSLFIIAVTLTACNNQTDEVYEFFQNAELQYETKAQEEYIIEALYNITNFNLSEDELKQKRYEDYMGKEFQWNLLELLNYHLVHLDKSIILGDDFYSEYRRKEIQGMIEEIIAEIQSNEQDYEITVGNNIKFDIGNDDSGKQEKLIVFTLVVTNLSDTMPVPVLSNENVFNHATFFVNNKEYTFPVLIGEEYDKHIHEKDVLLKGKSDSFTWKTSTDYLKTEYGNIFTVQWKYLDTFSEILEININKKTAIK
ncbi:MAG: hypothetical protein U9Q83_00145 [Bacteroidota bacterium]|nr:hypothetical protein [Bacteroidota bacterium]